MTVSLVKGQKVNLTKDNAGLQHLHVGLGWDVGGFEGAKFDLDASAFLLGSNGKVRSDNDFIYYNNLKSGNGSIYSMGDNRTGEGDGDDEVLKIDLTNVPSDVDKIVFAVTIYEAEKNHQNFGMVNSAFIRILNEDTNEEILKYDLSEDLSIEDGAIFGELYRHDGEWKFTAVGSGYQSGLAAMGSAFGVNL